MGWFGEGGLSVLSSTCIVTGTYRYAENSYLSVLASVPYLLVGGKGTFLLIGGR